MGARYIMGMEDKMTEDSGMDTLTTTEKVVSEMAVFLHNLCKGKTIIYNENLPSLLRHLRDAAEAVYSIYAAEQARKEFNER